MEKKIKRIYDFCNDISRKHQSGLLSVAEFNRFFAIAQTELVNYLISIHPVNEMADEYLQPVITTAPVTASSTGIITKPTGFLYYLSGSYNGKPIHKLTSNQIDTYEQIPQRRGDLAKNRVNIAGIDNGWEARPASAFTAKIRYVKNVPEAKLVFTKETVSGEDRLVYNDASSIDCVWNESCINLLGYMMLEKRGVSIREQLLQEYSQLGIAKESIK